MSKLVIQLPAVRDITIKVVDDGETPSALGSVSIELDSSNIMGNPDYTGTTGVGGGKATIKDVADDTYYVRLTKSGYIYAGGTITVDSSHDDFELEMTEDE